MRGRPYRILLLARTCGPVVRPPRLRRLARWGVPWLAFVANFAMAGSVPVLAVRGVPRHLSLYLGAIPDVSRSWASYIMLARGG